MSPLLLPAALWLAVHAGMAGAAEAPGSAVPVTSLGQMFVGLVLVLAAIAGTAWLAKRVGPRHPAAGNALRIVAGAAVGQRERVVVLEIGTTWLVVGVAPGSVSALHNLPRPEITPETAAPVTTTAPFASWLQQVIEKRRGR